MCLPIDPEFECAESAQPFPGSLSSAVCHRDGNFATRADFAVFAHIHRRRSESKNESRDRYAVHRVPPGICSNKRSSEWPRFRLFWCNAETLPAMWTAVFLYSYIPAKMTQAAPDFAGVGRFNLCDRNP